jgi:hypothetical protein
VSTPLSPALFTLHEVRQERYGESLFTIEAYVLDINGDRIGSVVLARIERALGIWEVTFARPMAPVVKFASESAALKYAKKALGLTNTKKSNPPPLSGPHVHHIAHSSSEFYTFDCGVIAKAQETFRFSSRPTATPDGFRFSHLAQNTSCPDCLKALRKPTKLGKSPDAAPADKRVLGRLRGVGRVLVNTDSPIGLKTRAPAKPKRGGK